MGHYRAQWKQLHWTVRLGSWIVLFVGLYAAAGFWGVPALGTYFLENQAAERLEKTVRVQKIAFNPFTWTFEFHGLEVHDADSSQPVLALESVGGDVQFSSLTDLALRIDNVRFNGIRVHTAGFDLPGDVFRVHLDKLRAATTAGLQRSKDPEGNWFPVVNGTLGVRGLSVDAVGDGRVLALEGATVELKRFAPSQGSAAIGAVQLSAPFVKVLRDQNGTLNWGTYFAAPASDKAPRSAANSTDPFALSVASVTIKGAQAVFEDHSVTAPVQKTISGLNATVTNVDTVSPAPGQFELALATQAHETVQCQGEFTLAPLSAQGTLAFDGMNVPPYAPYYQAALPFTLTAGRVQGETAFQFSSQAQNTFTLSQLGVQLSHLVVHDPEHQRDILTLPQSKVSNGTLRLEDQAVRLASVTLEGGQLQLLRHDDGQLQLLRLFELAASEGARSPEPSEYKAATGQNATSTPWTVRVDEVDLTDWGLHLEDRAAPRPGVLTIADLNVALRNVDSTRTSPLRLVTNATFERGGTLAVAGTLHPDELTGSGSFSLARLDVRSGAMYLPQHLRLSLRRGLLQADGNWELRPGDPVAPLVTGNVALSGFEAADPDTGNTLLGLERLNVQGVRATFPKQDIGIQKIQVIEPYADVRIDENGRVNLAAALGNQSKATAAKAHNATAEQGPSDTDASNSELRLAVQQLEVEKGHLAFQDRTFSPAMATSVHELALSMDGLVLGSPQSSRITAQGKIDGHAPLHLQGSIAPFAQPVQSDVTLQLRNLDMVTLSPYLRKYLAYPVSTGQLTWQSSITTKENTLQAANQFRFERFVLGDKVQDSDAPNVPVRLALALLQDGQGNMDLDVPVHGNMNEPGFRLGGVIMKAIIGVFRNIATAPFRFIGSMFGGGEDVSFVTFPPGEATLRPEAQQKLDTVAEALNKRPKLRIDLTGLVDAQADRRAIAERAFTNRIKTMKYRHLKDGADAPQQIEDVSFADQEEYREYLLQAYQDTFARTEETAPEKEDISLEALKQRVRQQIEVSVHELQALADQRMARVQSYLIHQSGVGAQQVFSKGASTPVSEQDTARVRLGLH